MNTIRRLSRYDILIFIGFIAYFTIWTFISLMRFYSLHAYVYDLGYKMQLGWFSLYHPYFGGITDISHLIVYIFFPIFLFRSYPLMLSFQSFFIGLAVFPLYLIIKIKTNRNGMAFLVGLSYLLFPLNIGLNYYDFHFMMFFPTLFLFGFLFFIRGNYKLSTFLFLLSGLTTYPFLGYILIFSLVSLIEVEIKKKRDLQQHLVSREQKFLILLLFVSIGILAIQYYIIGIGSNMLSKNPTTPVDLLAGINTKVITILFVIAISCFSIILRPKWLIYLFPYFFLVFYSNNYVFEFPRIMEFQYAPLVTPFIFLAISDTLSISLDSNHRVEPENKRKLKLMQHRHFAPIMAVMLVIIIATSSIYFNPLSPINEKSQINFNFYSKDIPNLTIYNNLEKMISLVPTNNPYLMVQNNMPEAYPRPFYPDVGILSVGGGGIAYNSSTNSLYVYNTTSGWERANIQYVLYDPLSQWAFIDGSSISGLLPVNNSTFQNMYNMVFELLASGKYGILAEANGMILLERGYFGPLKFYVPFNDCFTSAGNNLLGLWHGTKYTYISPGNYTIKLIYKIVRGYSGNISISGYGNFGQVPIFSTVKYINYSKSSLMVLSYNFTEKYVYAYVGFIISDYQKYFNLITLDINQTSFLPNNEYTGA